MIIFEIYYVQIFYDISLMIVTELVNVLSLFRKSCLYLALQIYKAVAVIATKG